MNKDGLEAIALSVRAISMDAVQAANSGHPGLPMGCADLGATLFCEIMAHNPAEPQWPNRDRFVLSAGHGSMLLYSLLHLTGYGLTEEDLRAFRQLDSLTPGHPEYRHTVGVETTTGPLAAGLSNAVGMAIAQEMLAARFNTGEHKILDHHIYVLAGDGCMMEGLSAEASSLAGHLKLGKLIVFYDSNGITIEGSTDLAFSEDVSLRYESYGWQTLSGSAHDMEEIAQLVEEAKRDRERPTLIKLTSQIGRGAATMEGSHKTHGAPLGSDEIMATRKKLGIPQNEEFYVAPKATSYIEERKAHWKEKYGTWLDLFESWSRANPEKRVVWDRYLEGKVDLSRVELPKFAAGDKLATRAASGKVLNAVASAIDNLVGGSADLAPSNSTAMPDHGDFTASSRLGRTIHFGVREHGMGGVINGMALYGGIKVFGATFLVFSDYMRPSIRLAAIMGLPVIYLFTHDSIFVGEDGPTHQPVEQLSSLRIIPNLLVLRPADAQETTLAWQMALERTDGPTVLALTRQAIQVFKKEDPNWMESARRGAYVVKGYEIEDPDLVIAASGSEVAVALAAAPFKPKLKVRIVSVISRELFLAQDSKFRNSIVPEGTRVVTIEAGVSSGWEALAKNPSDMIAIDQFGLSGPAGEVAATLGLCPTKIASKL